jgi:hypothetical protein
MADLKEFVNHPQYRQARKRYAESEASKWLEIAYNLCNGSPENLPRYAYAMKRYQDFKFEAEEIK